MDLPDVYGASGESYQTAWGSAGDKAALNGIAQKGLSLELWPAIRRTKAMQIPPTTGDGSGLRAMPATRAPGTELSATIRAFSAADRQRRPGGP
ncbi:hypothetical protein PPNSA23_47030 [Phyllobacterium phragmitis]|uniref:Uncharacterized protein n=1 Tax=Phyllobacterium phragmitis TaxID=2670329 RepID=A0ABQ0H775_9HYPH